MKSETEVLKLATENCDIIVIMELNSSTMKCPDINRSKSQTAFLEK